MKTLFIMLILIAFTASFAYALNEPGGFADPLLLF